MSEPKAEDTAVEAMEMDAHLDAAIRELRRVGDAQASPVAEGDADLDHELFGDEAGPSAVAYPVTAPEATPTLRFEPAAAIADKPEAASSDTIHSSMTTADNTREAHTAVVDPPAVDGAPIAQEAVTHEQATDAVVAAPVAPAVKPVEPMPAAAASEPVRMAPSSDEPSPPTLSPEPANPADITPLPRRMFGLRRALDAHRQGVPVGDFPEAPEPARVAEPRAVAAPVPEPASSPEPVAESVPEPEQRPEPETPPSATTLATAVSAAPAPEVRPEPRGWFGSRNKPESAAEVLAQDVTAPDVAAPQAVTTAGPLAAVAAVGALAAAASTAAPEPSPKADRRGWFGFRKKAEPPPVESPPPEPLVDLTPVREAMRAAAEKRAQELQAGSQTTVIVSPSGDAAVTTNPMPQPAAAGRVGVLLVNLGTPEAPTARAVRNYLREFLADKRVIEKDSFLWQLVLRGIILPWRPRFKARAYRTIWNRVNNESPLKTVTRAQATKLGEALAGIDSTVLVDWAMRYGQPSIESRLKAMMAQGCGRILVLSLYPQYSSATTATVCDEVFRVLSRIRNQPAVRFAPAYYAEPAYINALADSIKAEVATLSFVPEAIVASFHGMPLEYVQKGDPYYDQCIATTRLLRERLGMNEQTFILTFQSRFGRAEWLQPYTMETLRKLARDGVKNVAVVTPGFSADCLETLEEIAMENAHAFKKKGGKNFAFIPCLNDSERGMSVIWDIATRELKGWV